MVNSSKLKEKIMDFCLDEGILGKKLPDNPKVEFAFELNFPPNSPKPMKIILIKPKDKKAIIFQIATQIAPPHVKALNTKDSQGLLKFFHHFKKFMLVQNLSFNADVKNARYIISEMLYEDGITEDRFYKKVRKVFNTSLYVNIMLQEMVGGNIKGTKSLSDSGFDETDFTNGGTMYS